MSYGVTTEGFALKNYDAILTEMKDKAKELFGSDIDLSDNSPLLKILQDVALEIYNQWATLQLTYQAAYIGTAVGTGLEDAALRFGVIRNSAVRSTGIVTFTKEDPAADITILKGTKVATAPSHDPYVIFETTEQKNIPSGDASGNVPIQSIDYDADQNVTANTITVFVDTITGIATVNNAESTSGGKDKESDPSLRYRAQRYIYTLGKGTMLAIKGKILAIAGITNVNITEDTDTHTGKLYIEGGADADISEGIEATRAMGISVTWARPIAKAIDVNTTVKKEAEYIVADVSGNVESGITAVFEAHNIGATLYYSDLFKAVANAAGVDNVESLDASGNAQSMNAPGGSITFDASMNAVKGVVSITVNY